MRVAVVGVGLIGGSIGIAARERSKAEVIGWDPDAGALSTARERGAVDRAAPNLLGAVAGADVVFVAAPVGALPGLVRDVLEAAGEDCAVSDVGSTKRAVVVDDERFCGGHPLAGAETSGVEHARGGGGPPGDAGGVAGGIFQAAPRPGGETGRRKGLE